MLLAVLLACTAPPTGDGLDSGASTGQDDTGRDTGATDTGADDLPASAAELDLADIAVEVGVDDRDRRLRGVAAADLDGDGLLDLFLANPHDPATLLRSDGPGHWVEQPDAPTTGVDTTAVPADFDGDGDVDLFVGCGGWTASCPDMLLRNDGVRDGRLVLTDVSAEAGIDGVARRSFGAAWADIDSDDDLDLFVSTKADWSGCGDDTRDLLWRNEGDGRFTDITEDAGISVAGDHHQPAWLDHDEDGDLDLFVPTLLGTDLLYDNDGHGHFSLATPPELQDLHQSFASAVADIDADGHLDLIVAANSTSTWLTTDRQEESRVYLSDGADGFPAHPLSELLGTDTPLLMPTMGFQVGDLDLDGLPELFFGNGQPERGGANALLRPQLVDGALRLSDHSPLVGPGADDSPDGYRTHGSIITDLDADALPDLFVGNGGMHTDDTQREPNRLFRNTSQGKPGAVVVHLEGRGANLDAVGSIVRLWSDDDPRVITRQVVAGGGFNSGVVAPLTLGLGGRAGPFRIEVTWPDGSRVERDVQRGEELWVEW